MLRDDDSENGSKNSPGWWITNIIGTLALGFAGWWILFKILNFFLKH